MATHHTQSFALRGLQEVPVGSLVLVAHYRPQWRSFLLESMCASTVQNESTALWASLTEAPEEVQGRIEKVATEQRQQKAARSAYASQDDKNHDKIKFELLDQLDHQWARSIAQGNLWINSAYGGTFNTIEKLVDRRVPPLGLVVVDDIGALRGDRKKAPTNKQCGEHARLLKELALVKQTIVCAGMPAPIVTKKPYGNDRKVEACIGLEDLATYGSPHEAADYVFTCERTYGGFDLRELANRYS